MLHVNTTRFRRGNLPHWEVVDGRYFVTFRLGDSLPGATVAHLREIHRDISGIAANSPAFEQLQRQYFQTMEKYLDAGAGSCALRTPSLAKIVAEELGAMLDWDVSVPHYTIMPNHVHGLITPAPSCQWSLSEVMRRIKGRTGYRIRRLLGGSGPVWQREWFDRWIRNESEWSRTVDYIRQNPVKAHLVARWQDHTWTR
jgi:REP element-mobilizing transposase RayT